MHNQDVDTAPPMSDHGAMIHVLLVDDQRFVGAALGRLLVTEPDIALHCCHRAGDALAEANRIRPVLILQDLVLPDIDGLTMVRLFRTNPSTAATPVIVLSGNDDEATRARAFAEGAADYLVKLPAKRDLIACLRRHATAAGAGRPDEGTDASVHATALSCGGAVAGGGEHETLDRRVIAEFRAASAGDDPEFAHLLIDTFITDAASQVFLLRDARERQDTRALMATAHTLKGSSLTMGAQRLAALCARLETETDREPNGAATLALMAALDQELVQVCAALEVERTTSVSPLDPRGAQ